MFSGKVKVANHSQYKCENEIKNTYATYNLRAIL
jgi:hypothetical protein